MQKVEHVEIQKVSIHYAVTVDVTRTQDGASATFTYEFNVRDDGWALWVKALNTGESLGTIRLDENRRVGDADSALEALKTWANERYGRD
jgi:hypothetical protein